MRRFSLSRAAGRLTLLSAVAIVTALTGAAAASCSLGLDESLIGRGPDGAIADGALVDQAAADAGDGAPPPINPEGGTCTTDADCKGTSGCLTARCDVPRKACVLDVCRPSTCNSATCDQSSAKCGAAKTYPFRAGQFPVGAPVGCGGSLARCFAAVYPFVFVGTPNGVLAFAASDPQSTKPLPVPVTGLGFVPAQIVASGSRVFFLGAPTGAGASSRLPIAYVDVPPDPFAVKIPAITVLGTYPRPATDPVILFPRGNDTALGVDYNLASAYASTPVEPPLVEPVVFGSQGVTFTAGSSPQAVSGTRLLMAQINPAQVPIFGLSGGAGTSMPTMAADVPITTNGPTTGPFYFSQSADGAVFWGSVGLNAPPAPPQPQTIRAARGYFLLADGTAAIDQAAGLDLEVYGAAPLGTATVGPAAMLDGKTAMVTTSIPANTALTNVGFVRRDPLGLVKNGDGSPRRFQLTLPVSQLAAAGSHGLGYLLALDPGAPADPLVYVFDPACAP
ncbi:MAG: hypothetical protein JWP97_5150 [Labilithrix sp.]|nr:hypothetical protein [Labilithrix sp.]